VDRANTITLTETGHVVNVFPHTMSYRQNQTRAIAPHSSVVLPFFFGEVLINGCLPLESHMIYILLILKSVKNCFILMSKSLTCKKYTTCFQKSFHLFKILFYFEGGKLEKGYNVIKCLFESITIY
jgi:hypothetical protein